jgi:hypothetical protein
VRSWQRGKRGEAISPSLGRDTLEVRRRVASATSLMLWLRRLMSWSLRSLPNGSSAKPVRLGCCIAGCNEVFAHENAPAIAEAESMQGAAEHLTPSGAEGMGLEPTTGFPALEFQSDSGFP